METGQGPVTKRKKRSAAKLAQIIERGTKIFQLRKEGQSLREISARLKKEAEDNGEPTRGYSYEQVRKDFWEIVGLKTEEQQDMVAEARELAAERLEEVTRHLMPLLQMPLIDPQTSVRITDKQLDAKIRASTAIVKATSVYADLYGAKRPQKVEHSGEIGFNWAEIAGEATGDGNLTDAHNQRTDQDYSDQEPS
jgi:DNA-binding transcriptional MerR regulator